MAYGKLKANEIVYDTGAGDVTVQISSIPDTSSGITTTGEVSGGSLNTTGSISGNTLAITSGASAETFTGTAGNFVTATCDTGVFTYLSGTTTTGTTVNFTTGTVGAFHASTINKPAGAGTSLLITGDRVNAATGIFGTGTVTGLAATTIAAIEATDLTITATTGIYTLLSGATVTGGVFNGVSGNFGTLGVTGTASLTTISGNTVTGNNLHVTTTAQFASGVNVAATGSLGVYDGAGGYMRFKTPVALGEGNSQEFTTPSGDGTSGQLLATDGAGVLYWKTDSAAPGSGEALTGVNLQSFSFVSGIHDTQNNVYSHVYATSGTFVSGLSSNSFTTSTGTITGLATNSINATEGGALTLTAATGTFTTGTITGLTSTNADIATGTLSTGTITGLAATTGNITSLFSSTGTITGLTSTTATATTFTYTTGNVEEAGVQNFRYPAATNTTGLISLSAGTSTGGTASPSVTYYLPRTDGTSGYVLSTDAAGQLSWVDNGAVAANATLTGLNVVTNATANSLAADTGTFTSLTGTTTTGVTARFTTGIFTTSVSGFNITGTYVYAGQTVRAGIAGGASSTLSSTGVTIKNGKDFTIAVANVGATFTLTFPGASPTSGYVLKASTGGVLEWAADSSLGDNATLTGLNVVTNATANSLAATTGTFTLLTGTTLQSTSATSNFFTANTATILQQSAYALFRYPAAESSTGTITLRAGNSTGNTVSPSVTYYLPRTDGTSGYVLSTDAAGQLSWIDNGALGDNATLTGLNVVTNQTANSLAATTGSFTTVTATTGSFTTLLSGSTITGGVINAATSVNCVASTSGASLKLAGLELKNGKNLTMNVGSVAANFTLTLPGSTPTSGYVLKASTGGVLEWAAESSIGDNATLTGLNIVTNQTANSLAANTGVFSSQLSGSTITGTFIYGSNTVRVSNGTNAASLSINGLGLKNGKDCTISVASVAGNFTLQLPGSLPTFGTAVSSGNYALIATTGGVGQWVPQGRAATQSGTISQGSYALDVSGGPIQYITLSANTTLTNTNFAEGDSVFLRIDNPGSQGSPFSLSYPQGTVFVGADGNTTPTLTTADYFLFWKVNNTFYASKVGGFA